MIYYFFKGEGNNRKEISTFKEQKIFLRFVKSANSHSDRLAVGVVIFCVQRRPTPSS